MVGRVCSVDGCERPHRCKGLCGLHYSRKRERGDLSDPPTPPTECSVESCASGPIARGWCRKHYYRWKRTGSLADPAPREDITYQSAHERVAAARGPATDHACVDCDKPADEWSYGHEDPAELVDSAGRPYSLRADSYSPRCRRCHRQADAPSRTPCVVDDCGRFAKARSLCSRHYQVNALRSTHGLMRQPRNAA